MRKGNVAVVVLLTMLILTSCLGSKRGSEAAGGEVTGIGGSSISEPVPYGMVLV